MHFNSVLLRSLIGILFVVATSPVALACRLEAMMGPRQVEPAVKREAERFYAASLMTDSQSLRKISGKRPKKGLGETFDIEDLSGSIRDYGNPDGWGVIGYACAMQPVRVPEVTRNVDAAETDKTFNSKTGQVLSQQPNIVMAHVRLASPVKKQVAVENVHPFIYQNWSLMHNGDVSGAFSPTVERKIKEYQDRIGGGPKGNTDSERVFYYFLASLYEEAGTLDPSKIPLEKTQAVFSRIIRELIAASKPTSKALKGDILGLQGNIQMQPSCNFIVSDGQHLFAFKKVLGLNLGQKTLSNGQKIYMVASEKNQLQDKTIQWLTLPEDHILTITWNQGGVPVPQLQPLRD